MNCSERNQRLAGTAFRDHHGCPRLLPTFGHSHNGYGLCGERRSEQSFNPRRYCIVDLVQRRIFLEDALTQKRRVTSHVVVDRGQFWHGSPPREAEGKGKTRKEKRRGSAAIAITLPIRDR